MKLSLIEYYCRKCRAPRRSGLGMAEYEYTSATTGLLRASCEECTKLMRRGSLATTVG